MDGETDIAAIWDAAEVLGDLAGGGETVFGSWVGCWLGVAYCSLVLVVRSIVIYTYTCVMRERAKYAHNLKSALAHKQRVTSLASP